MKTSNNCRLVVVLIMYFSSLKPLYTQNLENLSQQKPVSLSGNIDLRGIYYSANGISPRYPSTSYVLSGAPTLNLYGLAIPFAFTFSNQESKIAQPFAQFGLSPTYKWLTLHGGYRNVSFNQFTLGGHTMLGAGIELTPGKFRMGFMYGQLNKATKLDSTTLSLVPVAFDRSGMAVKIGYGTDKTFFEISALKASDKMGSALFDVSSQQGNPNLSSTTAAENLALGLNMRISFSSKLSWDTEAGASGYTKDVNSSAEIDKSKLPISGNTLDQLLKVNGTTELYTAVQTALRYKSRSWGLRLQYRRIDPEYKTMGAYFFNSDIENITVAPQFSIFKNKFRFNGSIGLQRDNLNKQKKSESKKVIGSANLSTDFTEKLGLDINYSNYSNNQTPNALKISDTVRITQTTQNLSINPRYTILGEKQSNSIMLSYNLMDLQDFNNTYSQDSKSRNLSSQNIFLNYNLSFNTSNFSIYSTLNYTTITGSYLSDKNYGVTLGSDKSWKDNKFNLRGSVSYLLGDRGGEKSTIINGNFGATYQVNRHHRFALNSFLISNSPQTASSTNLKYTEIRGEVSYNLLF